MLLLHFPASSRASPFRTYIPDASRFHIFLPRYMSMSRADGDGDGDRLACKWAECYRQ